MGYSYAAKAGYTLDAIGKLINVHTSNGMPDGGFYETGREQSDGAITGTVWKPIVGDPGHCLKRGGFRIEPTGRIARFPGLPATLLRQAETMGEASYKATHGTWQERGAAFLTDLEAGRSDGAINWDWFELIFTGWQREKRIMFAVPPAATTPAMIEALRGMLA